MSCIHPNNMLEGRADGIHCRACGQLLTEMPKAKQVIKEEPEAKSEAPAKKPTTAKKGAKK